MNKWVRLVVTYLFGLFGVHKFIDKQYGMGILYLCTLGLFTFGWIYDVIKAFVGLFKNTKSSIKQPVYHSIPKSNKDIKKANETLNPYETLNTNKPNDFFEGTIYNEIRIVQESAHLIDNSNNIDTVISRLQFIPEHIQYLKELERKGLYDSVPTASDYYNQYIMLKDKCIQSAIIRNYQDVLDKANKLKTDSGRINRINKYFDKLEKYKPMLSPIMATYIDNFINIRK